MHTRIGINGFGRTGRATFRAAHEQGADLEWVGINDVMDIEMLAHLLRHDSVYGPFPGDGRGARRRHPRRRTARSPCSPRRIPLRCRGATSAPTSSSSPPGCFRDRAGAAKHLEAGARR